MSDIEKPRTTRKGTVKYKRKKHYLGVLDVVRQLESLSVRLTREELAKNPYACNALFEITRTGFYPTWQRASTEVVPDPNMLYLYNIIEPQLRKEWKKQTFKMCSELGKAAGIPDYAIKFVMEYLAGPIWNLVWSITDPFFNNS